MGGVTKRRQAVALQAGDFSLIKSSLAQLPPAPLPLKSKRPQINLMLPSERYCEAIEVTTSVSLDSTLGVREPSPGVELER
jgi:hypothetical protein